MTESVPTGYINNPAPSTIYPIPNIIKIAIKNNVGYFNPEHIREGVSNDR